MLKFLGINHMKNAADGQYLALIQDILDNGERKDDRTGVGTIAVFGREMRFDLNKGDFPILTTKKVHWKSVVLELLWFLRGESNAKWLQDRGCSIWDEWADPETGDLGPVYGKQWRDWVTKDGAHIDQIAQLENDLRNNPDSRRMLVSAWNVGELKDMALMPCHVMFQCVVLKGRLNLKLTQRSMDCGLGAPFNMASYALLLHMLAHVTNLEVGEFIHSVGDTHIYTNHIEKLRGQMDREPRALPVLKFKRSFSSMKQIAEEATWEDFELEGYDPHPAISMSVAK
jgi:thymidylate synthase